MDHETGRTAKKGTPSQASWLMNPFQPFSWQGSPEMACFGELATRVFFSSSYFPS